MTESCPGCGEGLTNANQNFCGSCGEPTDVEVDRERIRRQTSGFIGPRTRSRVIDSVTGDRGPHHEYTHVKIQEQVRHSLFDFWLLNQWGEFDDREALLGDIAREDFDPKDEDQQNYGRTILGTYRFFFQSVSVGFIAKMVFDKIRQEFEGETELNSDDLDNVTDVSLELILDGDSMDEPVTFSYEDRL